MSLYLHFLQRVECKENEGQRGDKQCMQTWWTKWPRMSQTPCTIYSSDTRTASTMVVSKQLPQSGCVIALSGSIFPKCVFYSIDSCAKTINECINCAAKKCAPVVRHIYLTAVKYRWKCNLSVAGNVCTENTMVVNKRWHRRAFYMTGTKGVEEIQQQKGDFQAKEFKGHKKLWLNSKPFYTTRIQN